MWEDKTYLFYTIEDCLAYIKQDEYPGPFTIRWITAAVTP